MIKLPRGALQARPDGFHERLALAADLREKGNRKYQASDFTSAMMFALGALHCIDFSQATFGELFAFRRCRGDVAGQHPLAAVADQFSGAPNVA